MIIIKEKSIWIDTVDLIPFPKLDKDIETDVLIIGGGITGILCSYELKNRNISSVILEKNRIGHGITKNTTAFISAQHEKLYYEIIEEVGVDKAKEYLELNLKAIERYKELSKIYDIDFEECNSTLFTTQSNEKIEKEKEALNLLGANYFEIDKLPLDNINIIKGISFPNQGVLHPLKLIKELSKELVIYENSEVIKLRDNYAYTKTNKIKFNKVIIATHFPFINRSGLYFTKMYQRRSYVVALKYPKINGTYCSIDEDGLYFRQYGDYLIIGGNDRDTKSKQQNDFINKIKQILNKNDIEYYWSNQDCITIDNIPYIGKYDSIHPSWYVATGFNLWGFTWAMSSAFILIDLIVKNHNYPLVDPSRCFVKKQLFVNLGNTMKNLITIKKPRCTHLGCALKWNENDNVYECPCHGSRFNKDGQLIDGPARKDLR